MMIVYAVAEFRCGKRFLKHVHGNINDEPHISQAQFIITPENINIAWFSQASTK